MISHRHRGFTLVELLVVVSIVAVLAILGFAAMQRAKVSARMSQSMGNLRQLAIANIAYAAEHGTYAPAQDRYNKIRWHGSRKGNSNEFDSTQGYLSPYLGKSRSVGVCPGFLDAVTKGSFEQSSGGYGYNSTYIGGTPEDFTKPNYPSKVTDPSQTIMFATTALAKSNGIQEYPYAEPYQWVDPNWKLKGSLQPSIHFRFNGKALIAWCNGSITAETSTEYGAKNYYGGDNKKAQIGFFGPKEDNGYWNSRR